MSQQASVESTISIAEIDKVGASFDKSVVTNNPPQYDVGDGFTLSPRR